MQAGNTNHALLRKGNKMNEIIKKAVTILSTKNSGWVSYRELMKAIDCTADEITRAVKAGKLQITRKPIVNGRCAQGIDSLFVFPAN